jgi:DNA-binding NarL/FixJ family response regulator
VADQPADEPIRVAIADDHPVYREGLATLLSSVPGLSVVGTAADGRQAVDAALELQPDVVVMDVQMPALDGIEATRRLTSQSPSVGVVVLTMSEDDETVFAAVRAGARGYLLKGADQTEVVRAITAVAGGGAVFGASLARRIADFFAAGTARTGHGVSPAHVAGAGGPGAGRGRAVQRSDRPDALPVAKDRAEQRVQRAGEAAGRRPCGGHRPRPRGRPGALRGGRAGHPRVPVDAAPTRRDSC